MRFIIDFWIFIATLVGYIPSHIIRLFLYRSLFRIKIGKCSTIHWRARFYLPSVLQIGDNSIVGNDAFFDGRFVRKWEGKKIRFVSYILDYLFPSKRTIIIGNNVSIAGEVRIFTMEHDIDDPDFSERGAPVIIEDYVVIGTRVTILPGVTIGKGAVVASGAVVTESVEPYAVVGGVPAKLIRTRPKNQRYRLKYCRLFQ